MDKRRKKSGREHRLDAELVVQNLSHGSQAVGGAAGVGDELHLFGQHVVVDTHDDGGVDVVGLTGGDGEDDLLGTGVDVLHHLLAFLEQTGRRSSLHNQRSQSQKGGPTTGRWDKIKNPKHLRAKEKRTEHNRMSSQVEETP